MKIGIDIDGVLANFGEAVITAANSLWPGKLPLDFVPDNWDYEGQLTKEEWKEVWVKIKTTEKFWMMLRPTDGAYELRTGLDDEEVYFITARAQTVGASPLVQSSRWLKQQRLWPRYGYSTILTVSDSKYKKLLVQGLGLKYMLDDYAPTVKELNEIEGMHAFVLDQPWNRYATELPRVYSVAEYLVRIKQIEAEK
jgi:hypothetical protein